MSTGPFHPLYSHSQSPRFHFPSSPSAVSPHNTPTHLTPQCHVKDPLCIMPSHSLPSSHTTILQRSPPLTSLLPRLPIPTPLTSSPTITSPHPLPSSTLTPTPPHPITTPSPLPNPHSTPSPIPPSHEMSYHPPPIPFPHLTPPPCIIITAFPSHAHSHSTIIIHTLPTHTLTPPTPKINDTILRCRLFLSFPCSGGKG